MTSLAQQLQKLAVPQTTLLTRDKKRASLLFDPKEAAGIDRDTFYDIGISGLKELIKLNSQFASFENSLFSLTSRQVERAVENVEINEKLNRNIKKFLLLLSPYLLLKPSQKALEWLIHRFSINEYNKDDCLMLIFPYHETNIFVKFLQTLNIRNENDRWHWLRNTQKSGIHLPKLTLFNHGASNASFLKFICDMTVESLKENGSRATTLTTLFSFFCTTIIGSLDKTSEITEPQISALLPTILRGLSSNIPDFTASCYLIIAKLLKKSQLSPQVLKQFIDKLTKPNNLMSTEATLLLILIYQTQNYYVMPEKNIDNLTNNDWFFKTLSKLHSGGTFTLPLIKALLKTLLHTIEREEARKILERLIAEVTFEESQADEILIEVLENIPESKDMDKKSMDFFTKILQRFETQYPNSFDKTIQNVMAGKSEKCRKSLSIYLNVIMKLPTEKNIFENLYHPNERLRENAVSFFVKNFPSLNEKERNIFKNSIRDRILDDSKLVIKAVMSLKKKYLVQLLGEEKLLETLTQLLDITYKKNYYDLSVIALTLISTIKNQNSTKKFMTLLPFLLPTNNDELIIALHILKTDFTHPILKALKSKTPKEITPKSFSESFYSALCENPIEINEIIDAFETTQIKMAPIFEYLSIILISSCLPKVCCPSLGVMALKHVLSVTTKRIGLKVIKDDKVTSATSPSCLLCAKMGEVPLQGVLISVENILEKVLLDVPKGWLNFEAPDESLIFIKSLFTFLLNGCVTKKISSFYTQTMSKFFQKCYPTFREKIEFLSNFLTIQKSGICPEIQVRAIRALCALIQKENKSISDFLEYDSPVFVPSLLIGMINPIPEVREVAMDILKNVAFSLKLNKDSYLPFLQELYSRKDEILLDPEQLPLILFSIYENFGGSLNILTSHATNFKNPIHILASLSKILTFVNSFEVAEKFAGLVISILEYVTNSEKVIDPFTSELVYNVILRLNGEISKKVVETSKFFELLSKILRHDIVSLEYSKGKFACPAVLCLEQIDREVFSNFDESVQKAILESFCSIFSTVENPEVISAINKVVKKIDINAKLILTKLILMKDSKSKKEVVDKRKKRSIVPTIDILETPEWMEGVVLLEFLQNKKKLTNSDCLLPVLFGILKKCLDFDEQAPLEYTKQLLLSSILHCCSKVEGTIPESSFNMELVVQCIRISQNPQTHHHALLLLSHCASLLPEQVLHNIMAIFTFMGSSVLRHDDAYSFQIISKIIDNVIPVLTENSVEKEKILGVVRVFVDVILDVPEHRRVPLFVKFLTTLGVEENLDIFLLLIFESHVFHNEKMQNTPRLQAAHNILDEFSPDIIVKTSTKVLEFLKGLPESLEDVKGGLLNFKKYTPKRFRHFKYTLITFLSSLLTSKKLINSIAIMNRNETLKMEDLYKNIIINTLTYIQGVTKISEANANSPQAQYYKVILHHCYDILDSINALLTKEMFLLVIRGLVAHNIPTVRRKALELLNSKLQHEVSYFYSNQEDTKITEPEDLFALLPSLIEILRGVSKEENLQNETELIQQTAFLTIKLFTKLLAEDFHDKFVPILIFVSDILKNNKPKGNILASTILCLAELVYYLRAHAISSLPKFMPSLLKILKTKEANLLLICSITSLNKIIESLPLFLSPYLQKIIYEVSVLSCLHENDKTNLLMKLSNIRTSIGTKVPARVLVPTVAETYRNLLDGKNFMAVGPLMNILEESLQQVSGNELNALLPELGTFFMKALDFRNLNKIEEVVVVEDYLVATLTLLVLKLSETTFRPFYYKLYDWAIRCEGKNDRIITFYRLSKQIAQKLKGLFVLFAGHFLPNVAQVLDELNKAKSTQLYFDEEEKCIVLLESILETLTSIFVYDGQSFIDKDRFELLMQPLVDQLENVLDSNYSTRCSTLVTPCIANFAVSTADDTLWKQLNYQILLKTRHDNPLVRLQALKCVEAVASKIGEDFLPLLPETIPFLAELLEDENENVESCCQNVVRELESILGEPLQKYF